MNNDQYLMQIQLWSLDINVIIKLSEYSWSMINDQFTPEVSGEWQTWLQLAWEHTFNKRQTMKQGYTSNQDNMEFKLASSLLIFFT